MKTWFGVIVSTVMVMVAAPLSAQMTGAPMAGYRREAAAPASAIPAPLREIGFDQRLDQPLPLDTMFADEEGREVRIGKYFGSKPVVLGFVYYDCPMLCGQIVNALTATLRTMSLDAGRDFEVVLVSFDPRETPELAAKKKAEYLARYDRAGAAAGWHFLTGQPPAIERLTQAAGFRYTWDEPTRQFAHPAGIIVVTPDGRPARYLFGHRVRPARRAPGPGRSVGGKGRIAGRYVPALLLSLRPDDRPVRIPGDAGDPHRRRRDRARARRFHFRHGPARAPRRRPQPAALAFSFAAVAP